MLQRNPDIKLYGLPWTWPGWLGDKEFNPYSNITNTVRYITNWITGAKEVHNLTIDYIGIWNERPWDAGYIKVSALSLQLPICDSTYSSKYCCDQPNYLSLVNCRAHSLGAPGSATI